MKKKISIEVVVDIVCPWCFVGKKNLMDAIAADSGEFEFEVKCLPYQLDPSVPKEGVPREQYLINKFGSVDRYNMAESRVQQAAHASGTEMHFEKIKTQINTMDCHRLIWLATPEGKNWDVTLALYDAYYTEGLDLSKNENLVKVMEKCGFAADRVQNFLNSDQGIVEVKELIAEAYDIGVTGVPFFIINRELAVSGAQPKDVFAQAFREL